MTEEELKRKMELRRLPPWWVPDVSSLLRIFLTVSIVLMVNFILQKLFAGDEVQIHPSARDLVMVIIGIILGAFKDVFGFAFGLSASDKQNSETISRSMEVKDKTIAASVESSAVTAASVAAAPTPEEKIKNIVSWWSLLSPAEQSGIEFAGVANPEIKAIHERFRSGTAEASDLATLVAKRLLTAETSNRLQTTNREVKP